MAQNRRRRGRSNGSKRNQNRLVGWLVSYAMDEQGKAFEIRSGRTMITNKQSEGSHIQIEAKDLSAPHLAMKASTRHQILVQDIFSEKGSYLQRASSSQEEEIDGATELEHGDWIRLGDDTRFQLCLIDAPSRG